MSEKAAILELNSNPQHLEHTVVYSSDDWSDMVMMLSSPTQYFINVRGKWSGTAPTALKLQDIVTVVLQGASVSRRSVSMFSRVFDVALPEKGNLLDVQNFQALSAGLRNGAFIAEFAIDTRTLFVRYVPPTPPANLFANNITGQTLLMATPEYGNLHFDIYGGNLSVAQFASDYMVDRAALVNKLLKGTTNYAQNITGTALVNTGQPLDIIKGTSTPIAPNFGGNADDWPNVIIEQVTGSAIAQAPGCVCVDTSIFNDGTGYLLGTGILKIYDGPCPPPNP